MGDAGAFWSYTLEVYAHEEVRQAALALQQFGADVNILLYCCWSARSGRGQLERADLEKATGAIDHWRRHVTLPLRTIRDAIKSQEELSRCEGSESVRERVLAAEIRSEEVTQALLERLAPIASKPFASNDEQVLIATVANLRAYLGLVGLSLRSAAVADYVVQLIGGCAPDHSLSEVRRYVA